MHVEWCRGRGVLRREGYYVCFGIAALQLDILQGTGGFNASGFGVLIESLGFKP